MIQEEIIINGDASGAEKATVGLQKEISNLKKELGTLDRGTKEYDATFTKLSASMKEQNTRMFELRKTASAGGLRGDIRKLKLELDSLNRGTEEYNVVQRKLAAAMKEQSIRMTILKSSSASFADTMRNVATASAGMVGAFAVVNGAMGLFSSDSEELQKAMLKVQQLMGIIQGLTALNAGIKAWGRLKLNIAAYADQAKRAGDVTTAVGNTAIGSEVALAGATTATVTAQAAKGPAATKSSKEIVAANEKAIEVFQRELDEIKEMIYAEEELQLLQYEGAQKIVKQKLDAIVLAKKEREASLAAAEVGSDRAKKLEGQVKVLDSSVKKMANLYNNLSYGIDVSTERMSDDISNKEAWFKKLELGTKSTSEAVVDAKGNIVLLGSEGEKSLSTLSKGFKALGGAAVSLGRGIWALVKSMGPMLAITLVIGGITAAFSYFSKKAKEAATAIQKPMKEWLAINDEIAKSTASNAASNITQFKILQNGWNKLNGNVQKQNKYLKDHSEEFKKTFGSNTQTLKTYSDYFDKYSKSIIAGYMAQAKAAAYTSMLQKVYEEGIRLDNTPVEFQKFGSGYSEGAGKKAEADAQAKRKKDRAKLKAEEKNYLDGIIKSSEEAQEIADKLNFPTDKSTGGSKDPIDVNSKYTDFKQAYLSLIEKQRKLVIDEYQKQMTLNDTYFDELQRAEGGNYEKLYQGTLAYYDRMYILKAQKIESDKALSIIEADKALQSGIKEIDNNIEKINENAKIAKRKVNAEEAELIRLFNEEKLTLNDNYNIDLTNIEIAYGEKTRILNKERFDNDLTALKDNYDNREKQIERSLQNELDIIDIDYNKAKAAAHLNNQLTVWDMIFGKDDGSHKAALAEFENVIKRGKASLIRGEGKEKELEGKKNDFGLDTEARKAAEDEYNKVVLNNSKIREEIAQAETDFINTKNAKLYADIQRGVQGLQDLLSNIGSIYDSQLETATNGLDQRMEDSTIALNSKLASGAITKEQYDQQMLESEDKYNQEVYELQVEYNEKQKKIQIFQAIIETLTSAVKSYSSLASIPIVGPVLGGVAAAAALASGYARVKAIESQRIDKPSAGSLGASSSATNASLNTNLIYQSANLQSGNEQILNQMANNPVFVSVVDINNVQNRVKVTETNSTF